VLIVAAVVYAGMKSIPAMVALPAAAAFLIEFSFYLVPGFHAEWLSDRPVLLVASCLVPYLVYSVPTGEYHGAALVFLFAVSALLTFWYKAIPRSAVADVLFLAIPASLLLAKVFDRVYLSPIPKVPFSTLGHLMLIRLCAIAVLGMRGGVKAEFRFLPNRREIVEGVKWFGMMLPVVVATLWLTGLWNLKPHPNVLAGVPQFFGILWVVALSEEFFFRGLLQQWLEDWTGSAVAALAVASVLFGSVHLGFAHIFPNWRFALSAGVLGLFCGLCWRQTRSVQASMVTHAIGATLYRVFFQS